MKKNILFLITIIIYNFLIAEEYNIKFYTEDIKFGRNEYSIQLQTDTEGRIIKTIVNNIENKYEQNNPQWQEIEKYAETIPVFIENDSISLINADINRKFIYRNSVMYVYYHDVKGYPNDCIIEAKYTYIKDRDKYIIKKYTGNETFSGINLYIKDGEFVIDKKFKSTSNDRINKWNYSIIHSLLNISYGIPSFIPMIFSDDKLSYSFDSYTAESELKEGNVVYYAENLRTQDNLPWVSGKNNGIGDKITIKGVAREDLCLAFYNGFQSKDKPYLYNQNSRAKKLKITYKEINQSIIFELKDSQEKQLFELGQLFFNEGELATIEIEILDVYPGVKYKDLCIQAIIPEIGL